MTQNETLQVLLARESVRAYAPDAVPSEALAAVVEAGRAAPYVQPDARHFAVLSDKAAIARLSADAKAEGVKLGGAQRALFSISGFDGTYGAPVVVVLSGNPNTLQYEAVCAASAQNMLIAATALGLASCWAYFPIFAFHGQAAGAWRAALRIPEGYIPCAAVLLGYAAVGTAKDTSKNTAERYRNAVDFL